MYFGGVCHAANELEAYGELCGIIQDEIRHRTAKGEALPLPVVRITRDLPFAAA